jgi:hypothetical protein
LAEERNLSGSPRRKLLPIGLGILLVLAAIAVVLLQEGDAGSLRRLLPGDDGSRSAEGVAEPATPSFRFQTTKRVLVRTSLGHLRRREKVASRHASATAAGLLTELYTEAFLDPANWQRATYADAFSLFASGAMRQAKAREGVLTAGPDAGTRFEQILPVSGRLITRVLLDRTGKPTLIVSLVRFRAKGIGPQPATLRSEGQFLFRRQDGRWKVVSFLVTRDDTRPEAA